MYNIKVNSYWLGKNLFIVENQESAQVFNTLEEANQMLDFYKDLHPIPETEVIINVNNN